MKTGVKNLWKGIPVAFMELSKLFSLMKLTCMFWVELSFVDIIEGGGSI
jgi:hypothetical protein